MSMDLPALFAVRPNGRVDAARLLIRASEPRKHDDLAPRFSKRRNAGLQEPLLRLRRDVRIED